MAIQLGIGMDTGGTYTDAVVYSFSDRRVEAKAKALTTREDLSVGILEALDALPADLVRRAEVIALSTTLATNACVENRGGRARLILLGGDERVVRANGARYGLPPDQEIFMPALQGGEPDWERFDEDAAPFLEGMDGVGIVEVDAARHGAALEKKVRERLARRYSLPVVCGHELFSDLNYLQRGAGTLLNARLLPVIRRFLEAMETALAARGIRAPVVVVRSDGGLMSRDFAAIHPVETLLCGPAASVLGAAALTDERDAVVVDMGGTTSDIALVEDGAPLMAEGGIDIGEWKTFVKGLYVRTFGLGGDSAIHYREKELVLEPVRVVPLCVACRRWPSMLEGLTALADAGKAHSRFLHEHLMLVRELPAGGPYTEEERALCAALSRGPLIWREAAAAAGRDVYNLRVSRLVEEGFVQICGLTPTDIMHIRGDFSRYDARASYQGARFVALNLGQTVEELCERVYDEMRLKLYGGIVALLLQRENIAGAKAGITREMEALIAESYRAARAGGRPRLSLSFRTPFALVGIGAPVGVFLPEVAKLLGTQAVLPEHHEVANALGAVVGKVFASYTVDIRAVYEAEGVAGYQASSPDGQRVFEELEEAVAFAEKTAREGARREAVRRGAAGEILVSCDAQQHQGQGRGCTVYLGTRVTARAVGAIGL